MTAVVAAAPFSFKDFLKSFMLVELLKGMALTGRYAFRRKVTVQFPEEKTPLSPRFRGCTHCVAMKTVKSVALPASCAKPSALRWPSPSNPMSVTMVHAAPPGMTSILTKCIFCGFCEESCPVDSIVETHIFEYHGEKRGDLYFTKDMLLAVGDRYEGEIAAAKAADAKYR
jgi:NADH-quinone oxidoreductase subunit I